MAVGTGEVRAATPRRAWLTLGVLGTVYAAMFAFGRTVLQSGEGPGGPIGLGVWFLLCVLGGAAAAGRVGGVGIGRGLLSGLAFLLGWLVIAPTIGVAFAYYLPPRPTLFGVALGAQLLVVLPRRGLLPALWRAIVPFGMDLGASFMAAAHGRLGAWGLVWFAATLALVGVMETATAATEAAEGTPSR